MIAEHENPSQAMITCVRGGLEPLAYILRRLRRTVAERMTRRFEEAFGAGMLNVNEF